MRVFSHIFLNEGVISIANDIDKSKRDRRES